ncbi:hypothetical protein [Legionella jordanis]|uniref:Uncharacterized protein n=1 Tax=Legionella jordanis TaxID=456 RepID=A0A0W0V8N9_9GAMM|nr:hypothetical protein [Legionella jordanis]KTD16246.1 hypothetical protein Ljor_0552 [Legionella jordanis]VEH12296.1 Uncharacterised protein [Legionella jordanis]
MAKLCNQHVHSSKTAKHENTKEEEKDKQSQHEERLLDKTVEGTFPASDATAKY